MYVFFQFFFIFFTVLLVFVYCNRSEMIILKACLWSLNFSGSMHWFWIWYSWKTALFCSAFLHYILNYVSRACFFSWGLCMGCLIWGLGSKAILHTPREACRFKLLVASSDNASPFVIVTFFTFLPDCKA